MQSMQRYHTTSPGWKSSSGGGAEPNWQRPPQSTQTISVGTGTRYPPTSAAIAGRSARNACPRCEMASFSSGASSAVVTA